MRKYDDMDIYRAHLSLSSACNSMLLAHWFKEKNNAGSSSFQLNFGMLELKEAAEYLGYNLVEIPAEPLKMPETPLPNNSSNIESATQ